MGAFPEFPQDRDEDDNRNESQDTLPALSMKHRITGKRFKYPSKNTGAGHAVEEMLNGIIAEESIGTAYIFITGTI